jgi:hypothetical protein
MAQHYDISFYPQKYFKKIELSFKKKFENGIQKVKHSLLYTQIEDERAKEHPNDLVFETSRKVVNEREAFEIHFDQSKNSITKIYLVK